MMQEEYVNFEQAKALKELGFPQDNNKEALWINENEWKYIRAGHSLIYEAHYCPTLSLVQKWLKEEKELYIEITRWDQDEDPIEHGFYWEILDSTNYKKILAHCMEPLYSKSELALSYGINKCIELLNNK